MNGTTRTDASADDGFGLVEVVVSMFLLVLLSVAFLPLLIGSLQATVRSTTVATATQVLSEQLDIASLVARNCAAFDSYETAALPVVTDDRGTQYQAVRSVTGCPASTFPATVTVTVSVDVAGQPDLDLHATTLAVVESAN